MEVAQTEECASRERGCSCPGSKGDLHEWETCDPLRVGGVGPAPLRFALIRVLRKGRLREDLHQAGGEGSLPQLSILRRSNADFSLESLAKGYV